MLSFPDRLDAAVDRCGNPVMVGSIPAPIFCPRVWPFPGRHHPPGDGRGLRPVLPRRARRGCLAGAGRQAAGCLLRATWAAGHGRIGRTHRLRPTARTDRHSRRQTERHRLDGHGLRPGLSGTREPVGGRRADREPLSRRRQPAAVCRSGGRAGRRRFCFGQDLESWRGYVAGPRGRRAAALSACGGICRAACRADRRGVRLWGDWGRCRGDLSGPTGRATGRHAAHMVPGPRFRRQGGAAADVAAAFDARGRGAIINNSRGILFAYKRSRPMPSASVRPAGKRRSRPPLAT